MFKTNQQTIFNFLGKITQALLGLTTLIITSKFYGAEGRGEISLFLTHVVFIQMLFDFGSSTSNINLSYKYDTRNLWLSSNIWILSLGIFFLLVGIIVKPISNWFFVWMSAFLFSFLNNNLLILIGKRQFNVRNSLLILNTIFLISFLLLQKIFEVKLENYFWFHFSSIFLVLLISFLFLKKHIPIKEDFKFNFKILTSGFWSQLSHFVQTINYRIVIYIFLYYLNLFELGVFQNLVIISESFWIFSHSFGQIIHSQILNNEKGNYIKLSFKSAIITTILIVPFLFLGEYFWTLIFSKDFSSISTYFPYMLPGIVSFSFANILIHYLHAHNYFKKILLINFLTMLIGIILYFIFIPQYKTQGACLAWSSSFIIYLILTLIVYKKERNSNFSRI